MKLTLLTHTPDADKIVAAAAKLCYASSNVDTLLDNLDEVKTNEFVKYLATLGHESPLEHAVYTFAVEGVSRALLTQLTRHRIASYSVQSQRYVSKENFSYIIPPEIAEIPEAVTEYKQAMDNANKSYTKLRDILTKKHSEKMPMKDAEKKANEDARMVLPNACDTRIIFTMNARSLLNFFHQRCCNRAWWEIRALAWEMLKKVKEVSPAIFASAGPSCLYGKCSEGAMCCGKPYKELV